MVSHFFVSGIHQHIYSTDKRNDKSNHRLKPIWPEIHFNPQQIYIFTIKLFEQEKHPAVILPIADNTCQARVSLTLKMYTTLGHGIAREGERGEMASHLVHNLCNNQIKMIRMMNNIIMHVWQQFGNITYTS